MATCTVCAHPDRASIDQELIAAKSFRIVSNRYGCSIAALHRHKVNHIGPAIAEAFENRAAAGAASAAALATQLQISAEERRSRAADLLAELEVAVAFVTKLFDACDRWLTDPNDPDQYDLSPRASEIRVHHVVTDLDGQKRWATATLDSLIARVAESHCEGDFVVERVTYRNADPRELLLKAARRLESQLQILSRFVERLAPPAPDHEQMQNALVTSPEWIRVRTALINALEPYPEAREAVVAALIACEALEG